MAPDTALLKRSETRALRGLREQLVLEAIAAAGSTTRPAIAKATGLSKPTVSQAIERLLSTGLIAENGSVRGHTGRIPTAYALQASAGSVVAIDVGGSSVRVACADLYGEISAQVSANTRVGEDKLPSQLVGLVRRALGKARVTQSAPLAIGVAAPGVVDPQTQCISFAPQIHVGDGFDLTRELQAAFATKIHVENNVNMAAIGEKWRGGAKDADNFAFIAIGAGIGMGLIHNDQLWQGSHGAAGEISYLPLADQPLDSRHRARGGLQDQVGEEALLAAARQVDNWQGGAPRNVAEIFRRAEGADASAQGLVREIGDRLGLAVASVCAVVDPGLIVLGGGIGKNTLVQDMIRRVVETVIPFPPRITATTLGDAVSLHGAMSVALAMARESLAAKA